MIVIETNRLILRNWQPEDWLALRPLVTDARVLQYIGKGEPWSEERTRAFVNGGIEKAATRGWVLWPVVFKANERLIGFCGFNDGFPPDVEIGWWLLPDYWGQGLATEAATAAMEYGLNTFQFPKVISVARPANTASLKIMKKLGMSFERAFTHNGVEVVCYSLCEDSSSFGNSGQASSKLHCKGTD